MHFLNRFLAILGYLFFTLLVLGVMLWYQFPSDAAKKRLETELHSLTPELQWSIGKVGLRFPAAVFLSDVKISSLKQKEAFEIQLDSLTLQPNFIVYVTKKQLAGSYRLTFFKGEVQGHLLLKDNRQKLAFDGVVKEVELQKLTKIQRDLGRQFSGNLSGSFSGTVMTRGERIINCTGNARLSKGEIGFQRPVLGMQKLAFTQLGSSFTFDAQGMTFIDGMLEGRMLSGEFSGTVRPVVDEIMRSPLQLQGTMVPRSELLSSLKNATLANLLKKQLKDGKLDFTVNGSLAEPGIVFTGLPADLNKQLQGGE